MSFSSNIALVKIAKHIPNGLETSKAYLYRRGGTVDRSTLDIDFFACNLAGNLPGTSVISQYPKLSRGCALLILSGCYAIDRPTGGTAMLIEDSARRS
jgi:hypothetical protein